MLWTQAVLAAVAAVTLVMAAEDVKENVDTGNLEHTGSASGANSDGDKKAAQDRKDTVPSPQYKNSPHKNNINAQDSGPIPVPVPLPVNHNHPTLPSHGIKRTGHHSKQKIKEASNQVYQIHGGQLGSDFQPAHQPYDGHGDFQASAQHGSPHISYQGASIGQIGPAQEYHGHHQEYDVSSNGISYQDGERNPVQPVYQGNDEYGAYKPESHNGLFQGFPSIPNSEPWPLPMPDMPKIIHLDVKCEKNLMKVSIDFDKPFHGIVFSKGHYSYGSCVHLPAGSGHTSVYFDVSINSCGTYGNVQSDQHGSGYGGQTASGTFFENTIVVQYDPQVQEVWDQARKLRCTWHDQYEKAVTFRPFPVDMLNVVRADFAGDNVGCWMQIQVGKGPWASEVAGIVKIGQTMTMVLAIKDEENKFDMMVRNCIAHDGKRAPIELVDSKGCIVRPKLMSRFTKVKNFGSSASVLAFAHFQAFKFPDSMDVHFQCTIQICKPNCPEQCSSSPSPSLGHDSYQPLGYAAVGRPREERDVSQKVWTEMDGESTVREVTEIGLNRIIRVVSTGDFAFTDASPQPPRSVPVHHTYEKDDLICMSTPGFAASLVVLLCILVISCLVAAFLCLRQKSPRDIITTISSTVIKKSKP